MKVDPVKPFERLQLPPEELEAMMSCYGPAFLHDLAVAAGSLDTEGGTGTLHLRAATRFFLSNTAGEFASCGDGPVARLYASRSDGPRSAADVERVTSALYGWYDGSLGAAVQAPAYDHTLAVKCGAVLQRLGESAAYPHFDRRSFRAVPPKGYTPSLSEIGLPELAHLPGLEADRAAVSLVRARSLSELARHVALFDFGQSVLSGKPLLERSATARQEVDTVLRIFRDAVETPGSCRKFSDLAWHLPKWLFSAAFWADAGLPEACAARWWPDGDDIDCEALAELAIACLGASPGAFLAAAGVFVADTGFNRQTVVDLPRDPIVFRTRDVCGIGSGVVLASFKARAHRSVLACIDARRPLLGLHADMAVACWEQITGELADTGRLQDNGIFRVEEHESLLGVLSDYDRLAGATRSLNAYCAGSPRLFVYPQPRVGARVDGMKVPYRTRFCSSPDALISRIDFPSLRKSVLVGRFATSRSMSAMSLESGNGEGVLWSSYLNTPDLREELQRAGRFMHGILQGLILEGRPAAAAAIGIDPKVVAWLSRTAHATTIAAAFGVVPGGYHAWPAVFNPTPDALIQLFLTHRAVRKAALTLPPDTWRARCLPVLIVCKAFGQVVCGAGFRGRYFAAARSATRALAAGLLTLPPVDVA